MKKATRSILSTVLAVSMAATACPVSFAATTSNEVTAREKANAALAREAAAQGMVLLENKNNSLPIKTKKLALFGGGAVRTVRGGTGSGDPFNGGLSGGGDVNVNQSERYNINIYNSFKKAGYDITTASILEKYAEGYDVENAKAASLPLAEYVRKQITNKKVIVKYEIVADLSELKKLIAEFGKIGSNLNQIARYFNTGGLHSQEMRNEIKKSIAEIYKLKYEIIKLAGDFTTVNANNRNSAEEN